MTENTSKPSLLTRFFRWLFSWRTVRHAFVALACFVTLVALFYTEEDWRGRRDWDQCRREMEAKGLSLDWATLVPPPVPDDQNFFKAPGLDESDWIGRGESELSKAIDQTRAENQRGTNPLLVAEVTVVPAGGSSVLGIDDPNTPAEIKKLIEEAVGQASADTHYFTFVGRSLDQIQPARITLSANKTPTANDLAPLFPSALDSGYPETNQSRLRIEPFGDKAFHITLFPPPESAAAFLDRSRALDSTLEIIRQALKRPYARMDGDYSQPYLIPIPKFRTMRAVGQLLADRTKCHLLLHQPEEALRDLTLLHDLCEPLKGNPSGQPMPLVTAMIHSAIMGLYAETMALGLRSHAWNETQLLALQEQVAHTDLIPFLVRSLQDERISSETTLEKTTAAELFAATQSINGGKDTLWARLHDPLYCFMTFAPRGWLYQNLVTGFNLPSMAEIGDSAQALVSPEKAQQLTDRINALNQWSPYYYLGRIFRPNATRAWQSLGRNQSEVNEAVLACALERYRLVHHDYPETLSELSPQFIEKIPHDIIGGQPLHYRREKDAFVLYSVGWNEKDDGGQLVLLDNGQSLTNGDWVWPNRDAGKN